MSELLRELNRIIMNNLDPWYAVQLSKTYKYINSPENLVTPLMLAIKYDVKDVVNELLKRREIDIDMMDSCGRTALWYALFTKQEELSLILLRRSKLSMEDTLVNKEDDTYLMMAVHHGYDKVVNVLLNFPIADINKKNIYGLTAFAFAITCRRENIAIEIMKRKTIDINFLVTDRFTYVMMAAMRGQMEVIKQMTLSFPNLNIFRLCGKSEEGGKNERCLDAFEFAIRNSEEITAIEIIRSPQWKKGIKLIGKQRRTNYIVQTISIGLFLVLKELLIDITDVDVNMPDERGVTIIMALKTFCSKKNIHYGFLFDAIFKVFGNMSEPKISKQKMDCL